MNYISTSKANTQVFFVEKNARIAKDSHIFSTKNNNVFVTLPFEILKNRLLMTSLILNNWPLVGKLK